MAWLLAVLMLLHEGPALVRPAHVAAQEPNAPDIGRSNGPRARSGVEAKIAALDARIAYLETKRGEAGTAGPVAMMVGGFASFGVMATLLLVSAGSGNERVSRGFGGATLGTLFLGLSGAALLVARRHQRAPYSRQIRDLRRHRNALIAVPQLAPTSLGLQLGSNF